MSAPAFVNTAAIFGDAGRTVNTANMPASIVAGRFLLSWVQVNSDQPNLAITNFTAPNWKIGGLRHHAGQSFGWCWKIAGDGGSDVVGGFQWGSSATYHASTLQFSGNLADARAPGRRLYRSGNGAEIDAPGLQMSADNSLVIALMYAAGDNAIPAPAGFTSADSFHDSGGSHRIAWKNGPAKNAVGSVIAQSIASGVWDVALLELRSEGAIGGSAASILCG